MCIVCTLGNLALKRPLNYWRSRNSVLESEKYFFILNLDYTCGLNHIIYLYISHHVKFLAIETSL